MSLLRGVFWFALFLFFAFCFVVLFEHGTSDFSKGFRKEFQKGKSFVMRTAERAKTGDKAKK